MTIFSSFNVGVNGINAQSNKIGVISDNISNTTTVGYKQSEATFQSLLNYDPSIGGGAGVYSPSGVQSKARTLVTSAGLLSTTISTTDLGIAGEGLFVVSPNPNNNTNLVYTRAGAFEQDLNGDFKNQAGYFLKGFRLDSEGNLPIGLSDPVSSGAAIAALETINVARTTATPRATENVSVAANLRSSQIAFDPLLYNATDETMNMASGTVAPHYSRPFNIVDSAGQTHAFTIGFLKTDINTWQVEVYANTLSELGGAPTSRQVSAGQVTFNGDGTLATVDATLTGPVPVTWSNPDAVDSEILFDFGTAGAIFGTPGATVIGRADGLSQFDSAYEDRGIDQDGTSAGVLRSVSIDTEGYVSGEYDNGTTNRLFKIPLAQFINPNQLRRITGDVFAETVNSSSPTFTITNQSSLGEIRSSTLELSNVQLETQLTDLIIAQRAYQANTNTVTTTDNLLQNLNDMGAR